MGTMPKTPEEWRDYEADRMMFKAAQSRASLEKTHSFERLVEMQRAVDKGVINPKEFDHDQIQDH